ncbi:DUF4192 domain-containing protein [Nocardia carnea]|uniref:DUF4192 domain-containing protein n=1 Tax=Nocardia carnea TaxID=37328 RepID=A0ABW7TK04_9NOCA|nr:DUF4192 domain-containing protein [Nocardia carnea]
MTPAATSVSQSPAARLDAPDHPGPAPADRAATGTGTDGRCPTARALAARAVAPTAAAPGPPPVRAGGQPAGSSLLRCAEGTTGEYDRLTRPAPARLDDPGDLIAAIPAMLGFRPERSLVLAVLCAAPDAPDSAVIDLVVRFDLRQPGTGQTADEGTVAAAASRVCGRPGVVGVLVVLVDEELPYPEGSLPQPIPVLTALQRRMAAAAVPVRAVWAAHSIGGGRPWWSLTDPGRRGLIADPVASRVTLNRVLDGRPIRRCRDELTALVAPDPAARAQVSAELGAAQARAKDRYAAAAHRGDPIGFLRGELVTVLWLISNTESGADLAARELADIAVALRDRELRDCMFALAATVHAEAAEQVWSRLARALGGADRAETAMLLGYFAYVRGDGPFAGIALDAALDADPHHSMATLLHTALEAGMRPERLRDLARCGKDCAVTLGVDMDATQW